MRCHSAAMVLWMESVSWSDKGREFKKEGITPAVLFAVGAVVPVTIPGAMSGTSCRITIQTHHGIMLRLKLHCTIVDHAWLLLALGSGWIVGVFRRRKPRRQQQGAASSKWNQAARYRSLGKYPRAMRAPLWFAFVPFVPVPWPRWPDAGPG